MYDYVKIKTDLLPISDYYKNLLGEYNEWQTKDYLCELGGIELRKDGTLTISSLSFVTGGMALVRSLKMSIQTTTILLALVVTS